MAEYIDREYLLSALNIFCDKENGNSHFINGIETAKEIIENAPTSDVALIKHGKWVSDGYGNIFCSVCGRKPILSVKTKFCPNCGAILDLED